MFFRLDNAGWYCETNSSSISRAALFYCSSADFLSENFTSERCFFFPTLAGYPLSFWRDSKFLMFSSNVAFGEFFYKASHLITPFVTPGG